MAGTIIADKIQTENAFLTLNVGQTLVATINSSGILNSSGGTMVGANGSVSNTAITGLVTASQIANVANTQITGNITSSQITSVANTQLTGNIISSQISPSVTLTTPIISGNLNLDSAGTTGIRVPSANTIAFYGAGTTAITVDTSQNVGIGTTSPQYKLDVQGNVAGPIIRVNNSRDTTDSYGVKVTLGVSGGAGTTGSAHFHGNTNAVGNWYLYGNGTTSYSSDQRLKKNIESARDGYLEDLCRLRVVKYNWNASLQSASKEIGLIAQEVEQVFPGLVQDDANPVTEGDDTAYKQLKQSVLPFMLLKAIQELKALNDTQAATITALTARMVAVESK
jgi:hypothetical protein